ncbi:MAG: hypothetical protein CK425_01675 [Parachlamydia sp.]|nr:MAG: hypothetical protein CK425_01675 [Parachlamydia sp.]
MDNKATHSSGYSGITVFDLDHTLFHGNSSFHFGVYLYRTGKLSFLRMLYLVGCFLGHRFGCVSFYRLHELSIKAYFQSISFSQLEGWADEFLNLHFESLINPEIHEKLLESQKNKQYTLILSNSPHFLVKGIAQRFQVDYFLATAYQIEKDQAVGVSSLVLGSDKASFLEIFAKEKSIALQNCTAYTDHIADLALLKIVGKAVVVKPNKKLRKVCLENKWTILE